MNPQQEEEKSSEEGERFQSFQEEHREGNRTPEELFLEHFTAEPVRDEILEDTMSDQKVVTTPASHPQEEWRHLEIVEDSLLNQYARSVITPKSRTGPISLKSTKSVLKSVVQTAKKGMEKSTVGDSDTSKTR